VKVFPLQQAQGWDASDGLMAESCGCGADPIRGGLRRWMTLRMASCPSLVASFRAAIELYSSYDPYLHCHQRKVPLSTPKEKKKPTRPKEHMPRFGDANKFSVLVSAVTFQIFSLSPL
jgi:hypothetical protein